MRDWARSRPGLKPWLRTRSSSSLRPKVEEAAPRSDLIDSPALYCKPVTDLVSSQPLLAFRAQIQARIASLSEEAQVRLRMRTWTAPMGDEIEGDLVGVRLQMPAMARDNAVNVLFTELTQLGQGNTILGNSVAALNNAGLGNLANYKQRAGHRASPEPPIQKTDEEATTLATRLMWAIQPEASEIAEWESVQAVLVAHTGKKGTTWCGEMKAAEAGNTASSDTKCRTRTSHVLQRQATEKRHAA